MPRVSAALPKRRRTRSTAASRGAESGRPGERQLQLLPARRVDVHGEPHQRQPAFGDQGGGRVHQPPRSRQNRCRRRGGRRQSVGTGDAAEVIGSQPQNHGAPRSMGGAHAPRYPVDEGDHHRVDVGGGKRVTPVAERALRAHRAPPHAGDHPPAVDVARQAVQLTSHRGAHHRRKGGFGKFGDLCDGLDSVVAQLFVGLDADAPQPPRWQWVQELQFLARRDEQQTVRFTLLAGQFRQKLGAGDTDGVGDRPPRSPGSKPASGAGPRRPAGRVGGPVGCSSRCVPHRPSPRSWRQGRRRRRR